MVLDIPCGVKWSLTNHYMTLHGKHIFKVEFICHITSSSALGKSKGWNFWERIWGSANSVTVLAMDTKHVWRWQVSRFWRRFKINRNHKWLATFKPSLNTIITFLWIFTKFYLNPWQLLRHPLSLSERLAEDHWLRATKNYTHTQCLRRIFIKFRYKHLVLFKFI